MRSRLYQVLFNTKSPASRNFDRFLLVAILLSTIVFILESVDEIKAFSPQGFRILDWILTIAFGAEYILRLWSSPRRLRYAFSFLGLVDLLSILPTLASLFIEGAQFLAMIRILRLLRVFRVLKMVRFMVEAERLKRVLKASYRKILVFLTFVAVLCIFVGTLMHMIEGPENGFTNIPRSIHWAVVTLTTVGYGDIAPVSVLGQFVSVLLMITGYGVIAVPTGLVSAEFIRDSQNKPLPEAPLTQTCASCKNEDPDPKANFCRFCGKPLQSHIGSSV